MKVNDIYVCRLAISSFPIRGPAKVLSHRPERSANREGKESVKFVDGLTNVARSVAPPGTKRA